MAVSAACALAGIGARTILGAESSALTSPSRIAYAAFEILLNAMSFAAYALLIGSVLRLIVPALPRRLWLALHVMMGTVSGVGIGFSFSEDGDSDPIDWSDIPTEAVIFVGLLFTLAGALMGAIFGGVQAIGLRRVALGLSFWIGMAAVSGSVLLALLLAAFRFLPASILGSDVAVHSVGFLGGLASAFVMLPALRRLRPRSGNLP